MVTTRDRILTAANELFRRNGFNGTSMNDITSAAGVATGSLYHFFPEGKEQLTAEVLSTTGAAYLELFEAIAGDASEPGEAVQGFFDGAAEVLLDTDFIDICPIGSIAREVASTNDALRRVAHVVFESWQEAFTTHLLEVGVARDVARALSTTVIAGLEGGFILARTARDPSPLRVIGQAMRRLVDDAVSGAELSA